MAAPKRAPNKGFTLLEVLVAVAILAISLTSLLSSQMASLRSTEQARMLSTVAFLAEYQLVEIEWTLKEEAGGAGNTGATPTPTTDDGSAGPTVIGNNGWGTDDRTFEGDFSDQGWPNVEYVCVVDLIEMPDYTALQAAADAAGSDGGGLLGGGGNDGIQDAGEQTFDTLGMVWPIIKEAIENSIRKSWCTVRWTMAGAKRRSGQDYSGETLCADDEHNCMTVATFWTDASALTQLPSLGGETTEDDDTEEGEDDGGAPGGGGIPGGRGGGAGGGGKGTRNPAIQPVGGQRGR